MVTKLNKSLKLQLNIGTVKDVVLKTKRMIEDASPGGGYCIGSSNSITSHVPLENYKAMLETVDKYAQYR